jgi:hypothetical protein
MKLWLYRHRSTIKAVYCLVALTVILILQILEAQGVIR